MSNHVLSYSELEDFSEIYAIYSPIEAFELAFSLNKSLKLSFKRANSDVSFTKSEAHFMVYKHEDKEGAFNMWLYSNLYKKEGLNAASLLLFKTETTEEFLLPEVSKANFLLKYSGEVGLLDYYKERFGLVQGVISFQKIPLKKLKSKTNLIVD
ncbi:MAG: hypothetical protein ABR90_04200 [Cryomorphaceae bacterium BACL29 MAG-121220-bin8]|nr:MAG: hypothetical protein ABR90_04200 [Cryomorphaceae bacterium BACL29 MAG-121220-bin8]